eukprot:363965-Chlamydomonas_euryale.AAC.18
MSVHSEERGRASACTASVEDISMFANGVRLAHCCAGRQVPFSQLSAGSCVFGGAVRQCVEMRRTSLAHNNLNLSLELGCVSPRLPFSHSAISCMSSSPAWHKTSSDVE